MVADSTREGLEMAKVVLPRVQAMVLCDAVWATDEDGVLDLRRVRTEIVAEAFPYTHPHLCVFLQVSGHEGSAAFRVVIRDPETDEELIDFGEQEFDLRGPLAPIPVAFKLDDCTFPAPGVYWAQVWYNTTLRGERSLVLTQGEVTTNGQVRG
jgi:hypothetical protein